MLKKKLFLIISIVSVCIILVVFFVLSGVKDTLFNKNEVSTVKIGIAMPVEEMYQTSSFMECIMLAVKEINASGGILDKNVELVIYDDKNTVTDAIEVAQTFSNEDINIVIGHWLSSNTIPTRQIYDMNDTILLSTTATSTELKTPVYDNVIINAVTEDTSADLMTDFALVKNYKNIAIYYKNTGFASDYAIQFEKYAKEKGINIIDRRSYFADSEELEEAYRNWEYQGVDAVVISGIIQEVEPVMEYIKKVNPDLPILGSGSFDIARNLDSFPKNKDYIAYLSYANNGHEKYETFFNYFKNIYDYTPDVWGVKGYDAIYLIKEAMESAGTTTDISLIKDVFTNLSIELVNGYYDFNENGELIDGTVQIIEIVNDKKVVYDWKQ